MADPHILIPMDKGMSADMAAMENDFIPLRIRCPQCKEIFVLFVKDFNAGLHVLLGQACPMCKRFIKESDDPEKLLLDLDDVKAVLKAEGENNGPITRL